MVLLCSLSVRCYILLTLCVANTELAVSGHRAESPILGIGNYLRVEPIPTYLRVYSIILFSNSLFRIMEDMRLKSRFIVMHRT